MEMILMYYSFHELTRKRGFVCQHTNRTCSTLILKKPCAGPWGVVVSDSGAGLWRLQTPLVGPMGHCFMKTNSQRNEQQQDERNRNIKGPCYPLQLKQTTDRTNTHSKPHSVTSPKIPTLPTETHELQNFNISPPWFRGCALNWYTPKWPNSKGDPELQFRSDLIWKISTSKASIDTTLFYIYPKCKQHRTAGVWRPLKKHENTIDSNDNTNNNTITHLSKTSARDS